MPLVFKMFFLNFLFIFWYNGHRLLKKNRSRHCIQMSLTLRIRMPMMGRNRDLARAEWRLLIRKSA